MSEVYNGGHYQYFVNKRRFDHLEVVRCLDEIGASGQAQILSGAIAVNPVKPNNIPQSVEEFIKGYDNLNLETFDQSFNECKPRIEDYLEGFLDKHESEFIDWVPEQKSPTISREANQGG